MKLVVSSCSRYLHSNPFCSLQLFQALNSVVVLSCENFSLSVSICLFLWEIFPLPSTLLPMGNCRPSWALIAFRKIQSIQVCICFISQLYLQSILLILESYTVTGKC